MLEGEQLQVMGGVQGDGPNNSYVWVPSIRTVIAGDVVFSVVHVGVPAGASRAAWIQTLDGIGALKPAVVVPGHQVPGSSNDLSAIKFVKQYMQDWDEAVAASRTADELRARMQQRYGGLGMDQLLVTGATAAFQPARGR
jgi:glyoxylase-like metal-dependent hydrolase (beta-lactamase superfamily II)